MTATVRSARERSRRIERAPISDTYRNAQNTKILVNIYVICFFIFFLSQLSTRQKNPRAAPKSQQQVRRRREGECAGRCPRRERFCSARTASRHPLHLFSCLPSPNRFRTPQLLPSPIPQVLPLSEQLKVVFSIIGRRFNPEIKRYVPSFKTAIDFFCIHAGGRAVLDGIEKNLRLLPEDMLPSRSVLHERGNTSSSSIWYELAHIEQHKPLRRGHQVLQLAFGSGFKCNSAVWRRLR